MTGHKQEGAATNSHLQMCLAPAGWRGGGRPLLPIAPCALKTSPFTGEKTEALKDKVASPRKVPEPGHPEATSVSCPPETQSLTLLVPNSEAMLGSQGRQGLIPEAYLTLDSFQRRPQRTHVQSLNRSWADGKGSACHGGTSGLSESQLTFFIYELQNHKGLWSDSRLLCLSEECCCQTGS